ncbi:MAG: hypothetical protein WBG66_02585, partial [Geitlerinemataceae cyanobacterium]
MNPGVNLGVNLGCTTDPVIATSQFITGIAKLTPDDQMLSLSTFVGEILLEQVGSWIKESQSRSLSESVNLGILYGYVQ